MAKSAPIATPIRVRRTISCHGSVAKNCSARQDDEASEVGEIDLLAAELVGHGAEDHAAEEHSHQGGRTEETGADRAQ
jgi:hypothetical protein